MRVETLRISAKGGQFDAYVARPAAAKAPAVVVIQEIFGVNAGMRRLAGRLAAKGYLAIAPDLFWRLEPRVELDDRSEQDRTKARALMDAFDTDTGVDDIQCAIDHIRADQTCTGKVGTIGHCLGGRLAYLSATRTDSDASVSYYGVGLHQHLAEAERLSSPLTLHIAEADEFIPATARAQVVGALKDHPNVEIFIYPGRRHAFARDGGEHYHAADAEVAEARTLALFARTLS